MDEQQRAAARERKRRQRQRDKAASVNEIRVKLSGIERERLDVMCRARAVTGEPYEIAEYISLLIDRDWQKLQEQLTALDGQCCGKCKAPLPGGCGGLFKGDAECYHSWPNWKELRL